MASTSQDSIEDLSSKSWQDSSVSQPPQSGGRRLLRMGASDDMGEDDSITTQIQMTKGGVSPQVEVTKERSVVYSDPRDDNERIDRSNMTRPDEVGPAALNQTGPHHINNEAAVSTSTHESPETSDDSSSDPDGFDYDDLFERVQATRRGEISGVSIIKDLRDSLLTDPHAPNSSQLKKKTRDRKKAEGSRSDAEEKEISEARPGDVEMNLEIFGPYDIFAATSTTPYVWVIFGNITPRYQGQMTIDSQDAAGACIYRLIVYAPPIATPVWLPSSNVSLTVLIESPLGHELVRMRWAVSRVHPDTQRDSWRIRSIWLPDKHGGGKPAEHEEDARHDGDTDIDETMSVQSYVESIFDAGSVGSSASSVHSDTQALVGEYVDFLVRDPGLDKLFTMAMSPTSRLGPERFRRNYNRILQSYARDLKRQPESWSGAKAPMYTQGLAFICRRSTTMQASSLIASRYMEKSPQIPGEHDFEALIEEIEYDDPPCVYESGPSESSEDESPEDEPNRNFMISDLGLFFREGTPFQFMKRNLRNLIIPSGLLSRVIASTHDILCLVLSDAYLSFLLFKVLSDPLSEFEHDQFDPKMAIKYFGSRLKVEARSADQLRMAEFLETYAGYIATRAVQRIEGMNVGTILQRSQVYPTILWYPWYPVTPLWRE